MSKFRYCDAVGCRPENAKTVDIARAWSRKDPRYRPFYPLDPRPDSNLSCRRLPIVCELDLDQRLVCIQSDKAAFCVVYIGPQLSLRCLLRSAHSDQSRDSGDGAKAQREDENPKSKLCGVCHAPLSAYVGVVALFVETVLGSWILPLVFASSGAGIVVLLLCVYTFAVNEREAEWTFCGEIGNQRGRQHAPDQKDQYALIFGQPAPPDARRHCRPNVADLSGWCSNLSQPSAAGGPETRALAMRSQAPHV